MSRAQPGAVILDQLRDRIVTGLYFGNWQPGERLPSIRDIADAESVDRKTAAAAYHRLEEEGLVEVKARSGVFLRDETSNGGAGGTGPLERLQKRWLKNTYEGARALGLDTPTVLRLFESVAEVESTPIPVIDDDEATAATVARELRDCVGIDARPLLLSSSASLATFATAAFVVTTPYHAARVAAMSRKPLIVATLSLELLHSLLKREAGARIVVAVPSEWVGRRVESALRQRRSNGTSVVVIGPETDYPQLRSGSDCIFVWPGAESVLEALPQDGCVRPVRLLSEATLDRVRGAVLEAALRQAAGVSRSSAVAVRSGTAGTDP
jgi:DNA-binding transcriptional regulator YhcF (GntR family)